MIDRPVYKEMPVAVCLDGTWYDDVVAHVSHGGRGCCRRGGDLFYAKNWAGHWHLNDEGTTWLRRVDTNSPEARLELLLEGLGLDRERAVAAAGASIDFCARLWL